VNDPNQPLVYDDDDAVLLRKNKNGKKNNAHITMDR
jgi:hypothetical protein